MSKRASNALGRISILLAAAFLMPQGALAQERRPVVPFEGTQAFQHILESFKLKPVRELTFLNDLLPEEAVVILFGQLDVLDTLERRNWQLGKFLRAGGSILIASDHADEGLLRDLGVRLNDGPVRAPAELAFRQERECPLLSPEFVNSQHPIFKNIKRAVATNRPGYLAFFGPPVVTPQAWLPPVGSGKDAFAAATPTNATGRGRVLVLAGHGVFVNGMLAQTDVDNLTFAANCLSWISDAGKRKYALFVEDGRIHSDFDVPLAQLPPLPIPPTRVVDQVLRGIEEEDLFNRILHENVSRNEILRGAMIMLSIGLIIVARRSLMRSRYRLDTKAPLIAPSLEKALSDVPVLDQRHRALLLQGNLLEAAQMLAQLWFERRVPAAKFKTLGTQPPAMQIGGGWWQRRTLERHAGHLWNVAFGEYPGSISRSEFQKLMASVERLSAAHDQGVLRFV